MKNVNSSDKNNTYNTLRRWHNFRFQLVFEGIIVGALAGLLVVFYRFALNSIEIFSKSIYAYEHRNPWFIPIWFLILTILACTVGKMIKRDPMISGSGIPQVEGVLLGHLDMNWWKLIIRKFIGGVISIGAGLSLGREGPSIQLGAAVGQGVSKIFKRVKVEEKFLMTSGASAGLAAAFNAPFAGVMFSLEEIHKSFSPLVLLAAMSASITADFISKEFFGLTPVFHFQNLQVLPLKYYMYLVVFGIILGAFGAIYNYVLLKTQKMYLTQKWLSVEMRPIIPFILAGVLGLVLPQVLGGGHGIIESLINGDYLITSIIILLIVKFLFSMISFGSGAPGGIFFPLLVLGALIGSAYGILLSSTFGISTAYINNFIVLGMAGCFTAIVRAPITGIILISEMTGSFTHMLSLTIVSIAAYITADFLHSEPVYESLLKRTLKNKNINLQQDSNCEKTLLEIPVHHGSIVEGKRIKELKWPANCLLVAIKRNGSEIIPKGNTRINASDYLLVLTNQEDEAKVRKEVCEISAECTM
jgi:H+/Cl- antiporter ClcA